MLIPLRVLIVEDSADDAELMLLRLKAEGFQTDSTLVQTQTEFLAALQGAPNLILADWSLPEFSGLAALRLMLERGLDIPFIIVSGSIGEEAAVAALRQGAHDYVLKDRPARLGQAVRHALRATHARDERKHAEQKIAAMLRFQNEMLDTPAIWIDTLDATGNITFWNHGAERISGYLRDEVMGHDRVWAWLYPDAAERTRALAQAMAIIERGERVENFETVIRRKDGQARVIAWYSNNLTDETGQVAGSIALGADVTWRRQAEEELYRAHEMLRTVLDTIPQRVAWRDRNGVYLNANTAFARDAALRTPEAIIGKRETDLIWGEYANQFEAEDRQVITTDTPLPAFDSLMVLPDGTRHWHRISKAPLHDTGGTAIGVLDTYEDITDQKLADHKLHQTLEELASANAELERFAYVASHDLQEPLRMVASFVQLLAERYRGQLDSDADEFIGFAVDGAQRMQQLINDLLAYSRIGTRSQPPQPTDAEAVLNDALWNLSFAIEEAGAVVTHDPLPTVLADRTQLLQLFQNLIGNALKFHGSEPPRVHVTARAKDDVQSTMDDGRSMMFDVRLPDDEAASPIAPQTSHIKHRTSNIVHPPSGWVFSVRDNGIGIAPEYHERIFGVFQRLHSRSEYPGTGIGLAICKRVVERNGGRIWIESQVGQGTTFCFTLPAVPDAARLGV